MAILNSQEHFPVCSDFAIALARKENLVFHAELQVQQLDGPMMGGCLQLLAVRHQIFSCHMQVLIETHFQFQLYLPAHTMFAQILHFITKRL